MDFPVKTTNHSDLSVSLRSIIDSMLDQAKPQANPVIVHTLGIPGAGKSSFVRSLSEQMLDMPHMVVAFDKVMMAIPEYQREVNDVGEQAFQNYELPARAAGYLLLKTLILKKVNVLFDHSGASPEHPDMLRFAQRHGYKVVMVRIMADTESVKERIVERQKLEGRYTPLDYVDARAGIIDELLRNYQSVADFYAEIRNEDSSEDDRRVFFSNTASGDCKINCVNGQTNN